MKVVPLFFAILAAVVTLSRDAHAQTDTVPVDSLLQKLDALDQEVKILKRQRELEQESATARKKETPIVEAGQNGFSLKSPDGAHVLKLRGYTQADSRFYLDELTDPFLNSFLLRRVRPVLEGTLSRIFDFRIMPDFAGSTLVLFEAYVDARFLPEVKLRVGKFKPPVGLERLQSGTSLLLIERALPTNLVPNRDIGLQVHGDLFGGGLNYAIGVFNGVPDGRSIDLDVHDNKDYAVRLFAQPFIGSELALLEGLGFGIAATTGKELGVTLAPALPTYVSPGQIVIFRYLSDGQADGTVIAQGTRNRISPQAYYSFDSFGFMGEYVVAKQRVAKVSAEQTLENTAYQATVSFVLTGEKASYRGVVPKTQFDLSEGTLGAFEIVLRFHQLDIDDNAFPTFASSRSSVSEATGAAAGVNWYLTRNVKIVVDYNRTEFKGGAATGDRAVEEAVFSRLQLSF